MCVTLIIRVMDTSPISSEYFALINIINESISMAAYSPDNAIFVGDFDAVNTFIGPRFKNHSTMTPYETLLLASS